MVAPDLPVPEPQGEQQPWEAALTTFVENLFMYQLPQSPTAQRLFESFGTPEDLGADNAASFYYRACAELLDDTREYMEAGGQIRVIAELFELLRAEGLKRDPEGGESTFITDFVGPKLRALAHDIPVPPGYKHNELAFTLEPDLEYIKGDSFQTELWQYGRKYQGQLRFWWLVGRLDANGFLGAGAPGDARWALEFHQGPRLLDALEHPVNRGVWETLWAAVLRCGEGMVAWGSDNENVQRLAEFKEAARRIAEDDRVELLWRGRFAMMLEELEGE
ncbi:hypothetical protein DFH06DRAFT_1149577 [Mycena polygramma]|nr:hypothetical protein DFH06DRAFT_1149577 [Mycena polygramma]